MSRKLDIAIAEALGYEMLMPNDKLPGIKKGRLRHPCGGYYDNLDYLPKYSTNPWCMIELVDEMQERGFVFHLSSHVFVESCDTKYACEFFKPEDFATMQRMVRANTIPMTVALAAYYALTGKEWQEES